MTGPTGYDVPPYPCRPSFHSTYPLHPRRPEDNAGPNPQLASKPLNGRVETLLKKMTLEEKIGQLVQFSAGFATGPNAAATNNKFEDMVAKGQVGSFLNVVGADATNHYQHIAMEKTRLHIPLIFGLDVIHGDHTVFPIPLAVAASFDPSAAEIVAHTGGEEARADGMPWVFSPMVDIARRSALGAHYRVQRRGSLPGLGDGPGLGPRLSAGRSVQADSVAVSVKHFAAYGAAIAGRDYNETDMSEIKLRQVVPGAVSGRGGREGAATLMSSFNSINGVPATANPFTLTQILRKEWGFDGFVVSDWGVGGRADQSLHRRRAHGGAQGARSRRGHGHGGQSLRHRDRARRFAPARFPSRWLTRPCGAFCA